MIDNKIIRIATNTKNVGLTNRYNFKSSLKNPLCGDKIKIELIVKKSKINSMKYESESCIYCEASASLLALKIKNIEVYKVIRRIKLLKKVINREKITLPRYFKDFAILINKNNLSRIKCINLPFDAVLKALR